MNNLEKKLWSAGDYIVHNYKRAAPYGWCIAVIATIIAIIYAPIVGVIKGAAKVVNWSIHLTADDLSALFGLAFIIIILGPIFASIIWVTFHIFPMKLTFYLCELLNY
jgi:hypothetical protein